MMVVDFWLLGTVKENRGAISRDVIKKLTTSWVTHNEVSFTDNKSNNSNQSKELQQPQILSHNILIVDQESIKTSEDICAIEK